MTTVIGPPSRVFGVRRLLSGGWIVVIVLGGLLAVRIILSLVMIDRPGVETDEALFVNAATLRIPGVDDSYPVLGVPLMVFPYIGALKSWLYTPIFALFGTSAASIRVPVVLIVSGSLVLVYIAVRDLVNRPVALLTFAALCFDNSLLWLTRNDVGPTALEFSLKCAALFCAARFARAGATRWLVLLLVALGLGVFNKINFIWTVNAVTAVSVMVLARYRSSLRSRWRTVAVWAGGVAIIYACFALYYLGQHIGSIGTGPPGAITQPWAGFASGMQAILAGTWFYSYLYGGPTPQLVVIVFIGLFVAGALAAAIVRPVRNFAVVALAVVTVLTAIEVLFTVQATAGWHYFTIQPAMTIVAAYGAWALARTLLRKDRAIYLALACVAAVTLAYHGALSAKYLRAMSSREPVYPWSPAIDQLSRDLEHRPGHIFTVDWGIDGSLFALQPSRRYVGLEFALESASPSTYASIKGLVAGYRGPKLFVTHARDKLGFPLVNANMAKIFGAHLHLVGTVAGLDQKPVFEIYSLG